MPKSLSTIQNLSCDDKYQVFFFYKLYSQTLLTNFTHKLYSQTLLTNFTHKLYSQTLLTNFTHRLYSQTLLTLLTNFTHKLYSQTLLTNFTHKFYSQTLLNNFLVSSIRLCVVGNTFPNISYIRLCVGWLGNKRKRVSLAYAKFFLAKLL